MHSTPERNRKEDTRTRWEQYGNDHPYTALPDLEEHGYMSELFVESGMAATGMNGATPLPWSEIRAFDEATGADMTHWEQARIMDMSRAYCNWLTKGSKQTDIADDVPYIDTSRSATNYIMRQTEASRANIEAEKPQ